MAFFADIENVLFQVLVSNYGRKRTSRDGEDQFRKAAAETSQDYFYVDNLLTSLDSERQAIKLVKNVKAMCESGGCKLIKFLSTAKRFCSLLIELIEDKVLKTDSSWVICHQNENVVGYKDRQF